MAQNRYKVLAKNTALFAFGSFGSKLISFFLVPLYTSILTTADYGTADMISVTYTIMASMCTLCIADAVMLFSIQQKEKRNQVLTFSLQVILTGFFIVGLVIIGLWKFQVIKWPEYCYIFLFAEYVLFVLNNLFQNFVTSIEKVIAVALAGILITLSTVISSILLLVVFKLGLIGYLTATCIGLLVSCLFYTIVILSAKVPIVNTESTLKTGETDIKKIEKFERIKLTRNIETELKKEMLAYSIPLIFNAVSWWINGSLDRYIIVAFAGIAQSGIYSVASKIPSILSIVQSIFGSAWSLSSVKESDSETRGIFYRNIYAMYTTMMVLGSSLLIMANNILAKFLYAKDFYVAKEYSTILIISSAISGIGGVLSTTFSITKKTRVIAITSIITAGVNTILNLLLIPRFGNYGAAIATALAFFVMWILRFWQSQKLIPFEYNILRDIFAFILLSCQVIISHFSEEYLYCYGLQALITIILLFIYKKYIGQILQKIFQIVKNRLGKN